jgi:hypothetical protein
MSGLSVPGSTAMHLRRFTWTSEETAHCTSVPGQLGVLGSFTFAAATRGHGDRHPEGEVDLDRTHGRAAGQAAQDRPEGER